MKSHRVGYELKRVTSWLMIAGLIGLNPAVAVAQGVDALGNPTGALECTGAGCGQGEGQGFHQGVDQGVDNGGPTLEDIGGHVDEHGQEILPEGTLDVRQGAGNGAAQGTSNGVEATNNNTGAGSDNTNNTATSNSSKTVVNNTAIDATNGAAAGTTGGNVASLNTTAGGVTTGDASIGVTQVKNDNTTTIGGSAGLSTAGHAGDYQGDWTLGFGSNATSLTGANGGSVRATNETTGNDSGNSHDVTTTTEEIVEIQNDGQINNLLELAAITGRNEASYNTSDGRITTGQANVAATLINLLNTTIINGGIWITVADIFGDLNGNIMAPDLAAAAAAVSGQRTTVDATNDETGRDSTNSIDITIRDREKTLVNNNSDITTEINAAAITGQNEALANTGGSDITTGRASVAGSNVSVANTTVEGGNWGLFIVNALNGWLAFLVGDNGQVRALSHEETIREIEATNRETGANSENTIAVADEIQRTFEVENDAVINNEINAQAITGQNETNSNTGRGVIATGNASIQATAVNIANTTVKDGSLFIAVVNIFGDWLGDLLYNGSSLAQQAAQSGSADHRVDINASNTSTGSNSENEVMVEIDRTQETTIENKADLRFALNAEVDTGGNRASRNTRGAVIKTGEGFLAQHSRTAANLTAIAGANGLAVNIAGENGRTGFDSKNTIRAEINDSRVITITNDANVSTLLGSAGLPALVNTGRNEANQNTGGAIIDTGGIAADVAAQNLVNRVIVALANEGVAADATLVNILTGALSTNENALNVLRTVLVKVVNDALVDTIINLLLNTGNNTASQNSGGGLTAAGGAGLAVIGPDLSVATGNICFTGAVQNTVNSFSISVGLGQAVTNSGAVRTLANITATTGSNETAQNTSGGNNGNSNPCAKLAAVPAPVPAGGDVKGPNGGNGGQGGDERLNGQSDEEEKGAVAATTDENPRESGSAGSRLLKRFPVAGGESVAAWLPGQQRFPLAALALAGAGILIAAHYFDRRARIF